LATVSSTAARCSAALAVYALDAAPVQYHRLWESGVVVAVESSEQ
jgi:hypothetical protein